MSVFSRLTDVINANLHSLLDKSEEPEKMLRLMIEEMEQVQVEMRTPGRPRDCRTETAGASPAGVAGADPGVVGQGRARHPEGT